MIKNIKIMPEKFEKLSIVKSECKKYFSKNKLSTRSRKGGVVLSRQVYMDLCREYTNYSHAAIAGYVNRDHATSVYAAKKIDDLLFSDDEVIDAVRYLKSVLEKYRFKTVKQQWREEIAKEKILNQLAVLPLNQLKKNLPKVA